jgi:hypothetical protein
MPSRNEAIMTNENSSSTPHSRARTRRWPSHAFVAIVGAAALTLGSLGVGAAGASSTKSITLGATANGRVITVAKGARITVDLANSSWKFTTAGNHKVMQFTSMTITKPGAVSGPVHACLPNDCGDIVAHYVALEPGQVRILAERTGTGTAFVHWTVVIRVR